VIGFETDQHYSV